VGEISSMAEKMNQRIMITKKMLKSSLIEILKTKSIYKVSIRELCEKAEINRSTFYKYYGSQFDLLAEMESDVISLVTDSLSDDAGKDSHSLAEMCCYLENNIELSRLLINNNIDPQFPEKIFSLPQVRQIINQVLGTKYNESEFEYISNFLTYGAYQIIRLWINKENRESPEEIANLILNRIIGTF
jgi:AcrR family transcriptional regulator